MCKTTTSSGREALWKLSVLSPNNDFVSASRSLMELDACSARLGLNDCALADSLLRCLHRGFQYWPARQTASSSQYEVFESWSYHVECWSVHSQPAESASNQWHTDSTYWNGLRERYCGIHMEQIWVWLPYTPRRIRRLQKCHSWGESFCVILEKD